MSYHKNREAFIAQMVHEAHLRANATENSNPVSLANLLGDARRILRLAATYQRLAETECNRDLTARERSQFLRVANDLLDVANCYGFGLNLGGDPRGFTVKLLLPSGTYNTWGGAECGYGVPTT